MANPKWYHFLVDVKLFRSAFTERKPEGPFIHPSPSHVPRLGYELSYTSEVYKIILSMIMPYATDVISTFLYYSFFYSLFPFNRSVIFPNLCCLILFVSCVCYMHCQQYRAQVPLQVSQQIRVSFFFRHTIYDNAKLCLFYVRYLLK